MFIKYNSKLSGIMCNEKRGDNEFEINMIMIVATVVSWWWVDSRGDHEQ